jgi:hypothetical protein
VKTVLKMPDYAVPQSEACRCFVLRKERVQEQVKRDDLAVAVDVVADLPADAPALTNDADALRDDSFLDLNVLF